MRRSALSILVATLALLASSGARAVSGDELVTRAESLELARHPTWEALLHVVPGPFGLGRRSEIPEGRFFLSDEGADRPERELETTLRALLEPAHQGDRATHCRYPARAAWLAEQLGVPLGRFAPGPCPALDAWRENLAPRGITLIAPEAFMNNPASMFGHTLLRLDVADPEDPQNLLAYAIDFMARSEEEMGVMFSLKGTFGLYPGFFGVNPYYEKLERYAEWENRDIWEYPLDLDAEQIAFLLLHLWELDDVGIPYYFFRQNCSYQLIRLLAVAVPDLELRHGFPGVVAPVDTIRDVLDRVALAGEVRHRASPATELRFALKGLPTARQKLVAGLANGDVATDDPRVLELPPRERAAVLEAAYRGLRYRYAQGEYGEEQARQRSHALLVARSRASQGAATVVPRPAVRPDQGHGTALFAVAGGIEDDASFVELRLRPGYHGRLESAGGFPADSTVGVLDTRLRWYPAESRLRIEELLLLELHSNTPRDGFFRPATWGLETGLRTRLFPEADGDLDRSHVWRTRGSAGLSYTPFEAPILLEALVSLDLEVGSGFSPTWAFGPGVELGAELSPRNDRWKAVLQARATSFVAGDRKTHVAGTLGLRRTLNRTTALVAEVEGHHFDAERWAEARLSLQWSF